MITDLSEGQLKGDCINYEYCSVRTGDSAEYR